MDAAGSKNRPLRVAFITSTPLNVREGSGTFVAIRTLADALGRLGPFKPSSGCCSMPDCASGGGTITT
jgi:hypothetical protein